MSNDFTDDIKRRCRSAVCCATMKLNPWLFYFVCVTGINMKFNNQNYPILIAPTHIPELKAVEYTAEGIKIGASVTLNTLQEALKEAKYSLPGIK